VAREAAARPFADAARAINMDWATSLDAKHIQRWSEKLGRRVADQRETEAQACERGDRPAGPANDPPLLVIGVDGGRVQGREMDAQTKSRWREDKVLTVTSMLPGDGGERKPQPLVTTHVGTMGDSHAFGRLAHVEAQRRGLRRSEEAVIVGDGAAWIDALRERHFPGVPRIVDWFHAAEHLHEVARATHPQDAARREALAEMLKEHLWHGRLDEVLAELRRCGDAAGPPREDDGPDHPRKVLAANAGYFERHRAHMDYPAYRARGWPIGSGITESGVKQFNKRVKGTDQFWTVDGAEAILALRSMWLSQDDRWQRHWLGATRRQTAA